MLPSVLLGSLLLGPPEASPDPAPPTVVLMVPERPGDHDERILATVAAHLHELDVGLVTERYDGSVDPRELIASSGPSIDRNDARGVLWIDVPEHEGGELGLYVVERDSSQFHGRTFSGDVGEAVATEMLANVAAMAVTALGEGRAIRLDGHGGEPAPEPEPTVEPELEPAPRGTITREGRVELSTRPWLRLRAGYRGNSYAAQLPWQSSVTFAVGVRPGPGAHVELLGDVAIPSVVATPELQLELRRYAIGLGGGYTWPLARGWDVGLAGRVVLEPTRRDVVAQASNVATAPTALQWFSSAEIGVAAGVRLAQTVRLSFGVGIVAMLQRRDFVIFHLGSERVVLAPQPLRAVVWAGFDFDLLWR